jgi:pimeloyl-ACP methyl ester carboxylesterase
MGGGASMRWWPEPFCERLAGRGRSVVRYDQRASGRSTPADPGGRPFSYDDLVEDAMRILDGYGLPAAHVVGMSVGGMIGQMAALKHPVRVRSLTAISSSPVGIDKSRLPAVSEAYDRHLAAADTVDWSNRDQAIAYMVQEARLVAGAAHPLNEAEVRALVARDYDRAGGYPGSSNFDWQGGERWRGRLPALRPPPRVVHGTPDPADPIGHGEEFLKVVAGARLVRIPGGGHELHPADWDTMIDAIVEHTSHA